MLITDDFENIKQIFSLSIKKHSLRNSLIISRVKLIEGLASRTLSRLTPRGPSPWTLRPMIEEQSAPPQIVPAPHLRPGPCCLFFPGWTNHDTQHRWFPKGDPVFVGG